jgi:hypothetical protein
MDGETIEGIVAQDEAKNKQGQDKPDEQTA